MFHVELRQFPHTACAFNLSEAELLQTLVLPWSREQWVELGERKWSPHRARLTVLEGPHLPIEELSMGRGWRNAQHHGEDVTERLLSRARASQQPGRQTGGDAVAVPPSPAGSGDRVAASALAAETGSPELLSLLGADPAVLLGAWRLAAERRPELSPSESLALAEHALRSLDGSSS